MNKEPKEKGEEMVFPSFFLMISLTFVGRRTICVQYDYFIIFIISAMYFSVNLLICFWTLRADLV